TPASQVRQPSPSASASTLLSGHRRGRIEGGKVRDELVGIGPERVHVVHGEDVGDVAVALLEVEAVPDDEHVGAIEAAVAQLERDDAADALVEQRAHLDRRRLPRFEHGDEVREGEARVHDVLDHDDVASADVVIEVLHDAHATEGFRRAAVARDGHVVDRERERDSAHEVREENRAALEDRDQDGRAPLIVPGDGAAKLLDPPADVLAPELDADDVRHRGDGSSRYPNNASRTPPPASRRAPAARAHQEPASAGGGAGTPTTTSGTSPTAF